MLDCNVKRSFDDNTVFALAKVRIKLLQIFKDKIDNPG